MSPFAPTVAEIWPSKVGHQNLKNDTFFGKNWSAKKIIYWHIEYQEINLLAQVQLPRIPIIDLNDPFLDFSKKCPIIDLNDPFLDFSTYMTHYHPK